MSDKLQISRRTLLGIGGAAAVGYPFSNPFAAFAEPQAAGAVALKVDKNVVVGKGGDKDLHVDIYHPPAGTEKHMALIHLHGGGFAGGSKDAMGPQVTPISSRGYVSITAEYRLSGVAKWPAQMEDMKTVIGWTRTNADSLGIDPNRIAVAGYSAGGLLALMAAGTPDLKLAACVGFYPVAKPTAALLGPGADAALTDSASPLNFIKAGYPPTIIYQGLADTTVPPESSLHLLELLRGAGVPSEIHTFTGMQHLFDHYQEFADLCAPLTDFFIDREVINPRSYPASGGGGGRGPATSTTR